MPIRKIYDPAPAPRNKLTQRRPLNDSARAHRVEKENRELKEQLARQAAEHRDEQHRQEVETVVLLQAKGRNLSVEQVKKVHARVERDRKAWVRDEKNAGRPFNAFESMKLAIVDVVPGGVRPAVSNGDASIPLPHTSEGSAAPPGTERERAAREQRAAQQRELEAQHRDQRAADRQAYADALRRHGLTDPRLGFPSGSGGTGFGT
jgi:hypothetical protein